MPRIVSVGLGIPTYQISQNDVMEFARTLFSESFKDIERLLKVFQNGEITSRYFVKNMDWFRESRSFSEKNDAFIEEGVNLGIKAINDCLSDQVDHLNSIHYEEIDAIFTICTTGLATPSLEARIMNKLGFRDDTKRIPIWGLGCAGGAAGLSRAYEYCLAYPNARVLVLSIELCSLTFQKDDHSKSNLIGTSLFADGAACVLVTGDNIKFSSSKAMPTILGTRSTLMNDSLDVMGWDVEDDGLHVVFSKDIPSIVESWLSPNVEAFLQSFKLHTNDISHFIAHPGGKKVLNAYEKALDFPLVMTMDSREVLKQYGNMSSPTIFYVLKRFIERDIPSGEFGLALALGPGFSSEILILRWE